MPSEATASLQPPGDGPGYVPFPLHALPAPIRRFVEVGAAAIGCDPAYLALPSLAACASAVGTSREIELKKGWTELPTLWVIVVAESGSKKTPAFNTALAPLKRLNAEYMVQYKTTKAQHDQRLAEWMKSTKADKGGRPVEPICCRALVSDVTVEALIPLLQDNPRGLLTARDELAGLFQSFGQYKGGRGGDLASFLEFHSGGSVTVDRKNGDPKTLHVERAVVSIVGGIQPGILRKVFDQEVIDSGFEARFLMAMPERRVPAWTEDTICEETIAVHERVILALHALQPHKGCKPVRLGMTASAKDIWVSFYDSWADRQAAASGATAATLSKLEAATARLALVHHLVIEVDAGRDGTAPVGEESMRSAVQLVNWFASEADRIRAALGRPAGHNALALVHRLAEKQAGRLTVKHLQQANSRRYKSADDAQKELDRLVCEGHGRWEQGQPQRSGGHTPTWFVLSTPHDSSDSRSQRELPTRRG